MPSPLPVRTRAVRFRPCLELLEGRLCPSALWDSLGPPFQVNTYTAGAQQPGEVASDAQGNFVVVWEDSELDGSGKGIYARRYDASARPLGNPFRVNSQTAGDQAQPAVAVHATGEFVITWTQYSTIDAQRYDRTGAPVGTNFTVFSGSAVEPRVFFRDSGAFAVLWTAVGEGLRVQGYSGAGVPEESFLTTLPVEEGWLWPPAAVQSSIRMDADGGFYIPYFRYRDRFVPDVGRRYDAEAFVRRLDAHGTLRGPDIRVVAYLDRPTAHPTGLEPALTLQAGGGFVATWFDEQRSYVGQRFDAAGQTASAPFVLISVSGIQGLGYWGTPTVATLADGNLLVAWYDGVQSQRDPSYFRVFGADGVPRGNAVFLDQDSYHHGPFRIATDSQDGFTFAWVSRLAPNDGETYARRFVRTGQVVVAADLGGPPQVRVFTTQGTLVGTFDAYGPAFTGGVRVATADLTGDGAPEIFTAPGPTGAPYVNIYDGATFQRLRQFLVYGEAFTLGVNLAVGNVLGDGRPEIVVAPERGGEPFINILDSQTGQLVQQFLAYGRAFTGGVRLALANTDAANGALLEVLTAPQACGAPFVNQFNAASGPGVNPFVRQHQVYGATFTGGLFLAAGNVNRQGLDDFIVGPGSSGQPYVNGFDGTTGNFIRQVQAYGLAFTAGVRVALVDADRDGTGDFVTGPGPGGEPWVQVVNGLTQGQMLSFLAFDQEMTAGLFVVATL